MLTKLSFKLGILMMAIMAVLIVTGSVQLSAAPAVPATTATMSTPIPHHSTPGSTVPPASAAEEGLPFGYHQPYSTSTDNSGQLVENPTMISINEISFDTRQGDPVLPAKLTITDYKGENGYYLVQYPGPITEDIRKNLTASGAAIIEYIPNNTFLVKLSNQVKADITIKGGISYIGLFQPAYKLPPGYADSKGMHEVNILLFKGISGEDIRETIEQLKDMGAKIVAASSTEWRTKIRAEVDGAKFIQIARLPQVRYVEPFVQMHVDNTMAQIVSQDNIANQRRIWYVNGTSAAGGVRLTGAGQVTGHSDSGVDERHWAFMDPLVPINGFGQYPTHRKLIAYLQGADRALFQHDAVSQHGTHTCGTICGNDSVNAGTRNQYCGMAFEAKHWFVCCGGSDANAIFTPNDYADMWNPAYKGNAGGACRIFSQSWGGDDTGRYWGGDQETDQYLWTHKDFILCNSAGNSGTAGAGHVGSPSNAKDVVCVGATLGNINGVIVSYSSRGATKDGRRHPTVCAPGDGTAEYNGMMSTQQGTTNGYFGMQGTSMACPDVAGHTALVRQYFTDGWYPTGAKNAANGFIPSAALMKAVLVCSGDSTPAYMNTNYGYGRINLWSTLYFTGTTASNPMWIADEQDGIKTGEARTYRIPVSATTANFKVTLVWTDYPGPINTTPELVNDLNLTVTEPNGTTIYHGNNFTAGQSNTNAGYDALNVEEVVRRRTPTVGTWTITVNGLNCPMGPQPYALVVTGMLNVGAKPQLVASSVVTKPKSALRLGQMDSLIVTVKNVGTGAATLSTPGVLRYRGITAQATVQDSVGQLIIGTNIAANGGTATGRFAVTAAAGLDCWTQIPFDIFWRTATDTGNAGFIATANEPDTGSQFVVWGYGDNNDYITWMTALSQQGYKGKWVTDHGIPAYTRPKPLVIFALMSGLSGTNTSDYPVADSFALGLNNDSLLYKFLNTSCDSGGLYIQEPEIGFACFDAAGAKYGKVVNQLLGTTYLSAMDMEGAITGVRGVAATPFSAFNFTYAGADTGSNGGSCDIDGIQKTGTGLNYMRYASARNDTCLVGNIHMSSLPHYKTLTATFLLHGISGSKGSSKAVGPICRAYVDSVMHWFGGHVPLAVSLTSLTAQSGPDGITIHWRTESENDTYQWLIKRSIGASQDYTEIDALGAAGNTSEPHEYAYQDKTIQYGNTYNYLLVEKDLNGIETLYGPVTVSAQGLPKEYALLTPRPNPFSLQTEFKYQLPQNSKVELSVYNVSGQLVRTLVNSRCEPGYYSVKWNGKNSGGENVVSGVYLVRLNTGDFTATRKVALIR